MSTREQWAKRTDLALFLEVADPLVGLPSISLGRVLMMKAALDGKGSEWGRERKAYSQQSPGTSRRRDWDPFPLLLSDSILCLQTENSVLAQANENQRETYERCLDEVLPPPSLASLLGVEAFPWVLKSFDLR